MDIKYNMVATTMYGLEDVLKKELIELGAENVQKGNRCVHFYGTNTLLYKANIQLRTALKILKHTTSFNAKKETELYRSISKVKWDKILNYDKTFSISSTVNSKYFTHSNYVSLVTKDAIVDQFRKRYNKRPSVDLKNPDINIHVHISNYKCEVSLNSSGQSLHKRGYRSKSFSAPMNEVLAAGIILLSNWDLNTTLIDPMCGSGTLLIEAGLIAVNRAPNIFRKNFSFQKWNDFNTKSFENIKKSIQEKERDFNGSIKGFDISASAISVARNHVHNMKLNNTIKIHGQDFFKSTGDEKSIVIMNPPYGKRIEFKKDYYKEIGDTLKQQYTNTSAWIISSDFDEIKKIGLKPSKKIKLFNGALECKLLEYELYQGSKKASKLQGE